MKETKYADASISQIRNVSLYLRMKLRADIGIALNITAKMNTNSMFYDAYESLSRASILRLEDSGIMKRETERLKLIKDWTVLDINCLPTPEEVEEFYIGHGIDDIKARIIRESYSNKLDLILDSSRRDRIC